MVWASEDASWMSGEVQQGEDRRADPDPDAGGITYLMWPRITLDELDDVVAERDIWTSLLSLQPLPATQTKRRDRIEC